MPDLDQQIRSNRLKSRLLFVFFFLIYGSLGVALSWYLGAWPATSSYGPLIVFLVVASVIVLVTLFMGDDMAVIVARGKKIEKREQSPKFYDAVEVMSLASGQPMPRLFISPDKSPNAFAAGRSEKQALICVNQGLLDLLDKDELEAVIAHEMAHIGNMDIRLMTYAAVLAGGIALISEVLSYLIFFGGDRSNSVNTGIAGIVVIILATILAPIGALLIQMSISRKREYLADASAVQMTKYPEALASALSRLDQSTVPSQTGSRATNHLCIVAPLNRRGKKSSLFSTHPPIEERILKLNQMAEFNQHEHREV